MSIGQGSSRRAGHIDTTAEEAQAICRAVCLALGAGWTTTGPMTNLDGDPYPNRRQTLQHTDGYSCDLAFDGWQQEGRIEVSANYPIDNTSEGGGRQMYPSGGQYDPRASAITVSRQTPPEKIAKEIQRRFLPGYLPIWQKQIERLAERRRCAATADAGIQAILAGGFGAGRSPHGSERQTSVYLGSENYAYQVTAESDGDVRFEPFSCPLAVALRVLEALRKEQTPGQPQESSERRDDLTIRAGLLAILWDYETNDWKELQSCADVVQEISGLLKGPTTEEKRQAFEQHQQEDPPCSCNNCLAPVRCGWHHSETDAQCNLEAGHDSGCQFDELIDGETGQRLC